MILLINAVRQVVIEMLNPYGSLFAILKYPQCSDTYHGGGEPYLEQLISGSMEDARQYVNDFLVDHLQSGQRIHEIQEGDMPCFVVTEEGGEPTLFFGGWNQREHYCIVQMSPEEITRQIGL